MLLFYFLFALIPVVIYIFTIYSTVPWKSIDLRASFFYFMMGFLSIGMVLTTHELFSFLFAPAIDLPFTFMGQPWDMFFVLSFFQVALLEEASKYLSFLIADKVRKNDNGGVLLDSPIGTMFYCGIAALGFSFIENVDYAIRYGGDVLFIRSIVSMFIHFVSGLLMGYWVAAGRIAPKMENRSLLEVLLHKRPGLRKGIYTGIGISVAVFIHGLFDFSIFTGEGQSIQFLIIFGGIISAYLASRSLLDKMKR